MTSSGQSNIRLLLIDDHAIFLEGARRFFMAQPDFDVVGQTGSVEQALEILAAQALDIVLLDIDLGERRGTEFLVKAREGGFAGPVLILTGGVSEREKRILLAHGAAGIILKTSPIELLIEAIRRLAAGGESAISLPPQAVVRRERKPLTEREREVLRAVFDGRLNKEIAALLGISETTVKAALQQLFEKTGVRTRGQLVRAALEQYSDQL